MTERPENLQKIRALLASGRIFDALQLCSRSLHLDPGHAELRHLRGRCQASLGHWQKAAEDYRLVMRQQPGLLPVTVDFGIAQASMGEYSVARRVLEHARSIDAGIPLLHYGLGLALEGLADLAGAAAAFAEEIRRNPQFYDACIKLGEINLRLDLPAAAIQCFQRALHLRPNDATPAAKLGSAYLIARNFPAAVQALQQALLLDERRADVAANLGEAFRNLNDVDGARASFQCALSLAPDLAEAHLGLGRLAATRGDYTETAMRLLRVAQLHPDDGELALTAAEVWHALGALQLRAGDAVAALTSLDHALRIQPAHADSWLGRGKALESNGQHAEAIESIEKSLAARPSHADSMAALVSCALRACDWKRVEHHTAQLLALPSGIDALHPFLLLNVDVTPAERFSAVQRRAAKLPVTAPPAAWVRTRDLPLRVAYLSPDFREHPVSHALAGLISAHDRQQVSPIGVALQAPAMKGIGLRLQALFDRFIDASTLSDIATATLLKDMQVDIAIDLAGHTSGAKPAVFGQRVAPIQVNFLGYPSSTGADWMDYIIADRIVAPATDESLYSEQIIRMPHCYLPFDAGRAPAGPTVRRKDIGLPDSGVVFCAFNNAYKITRPLFSTWLQLLQEVPASVLWLRSMGMAAAANLRSAAAAAGVDSQRLIFAPYLADLTAHIDRLRLADIFLDTSPYNAHTSATEALWAGVPVISMRGHDFAGRVGASVLSAAGLSELITTGLDDYFDLALRLARSPSELESCKQRVRQSLATAPLFDTLRYTRDFEALLMSMTPRFLRLSHS